VQTLTPGEATLQALTLLTFFTSTKVQMLTPEEATLQAMRETIISELQAPPELHQELVAACASVGIAASLTGTQFTCTCSTSTVQKYRY
jgi:hypothetical protein